jgi:hypothetical protein
MAKQVVDAKVLAMLKQFLKSTGERGVPQGSPLSTLVASLVLNDRAHALDRGGDFITYARYLVIFSSRAHEAHNVTESRE